MSKHQQPIPTPPKKPVLMDATVTFHSTKGDIAFKWSAENGDVTHNGALVHNSNDIALLHTIAKGMLAAKGAKG